ncbi:hypothetical protein niasHS_009551 [Heterodera schachtii]|uniref:Uncharacterized protein n=1 Tax=Heterodera schachtii TaxID=97005 RepID=A0ABD2JET9_HETSC
MALIYASAVNKRMHQLQKKRSMDITSPNNELLSQQMSTSLSYSTRGRPSQREEYGTVRATSRDCTGEGRKRSAPPAANRSCAVAASAGRIQHAVKLSPMESAGRSKNCRKLAVANGQFTTVEKFTDDSGGGTVGVDTVSPRRKISMPQTTSSMRMMMGTMAMDGIGGGTSATTTKRAELISSRPKTMNREKKNLNNSSTRSYDDGNDDSGDDAKNEKVAGGLFAQFTAAFRRRSVSMDERVFRPRHGTISSSYSISGSPTGEEYGGVAKGTRQPRRKESNTFRKMRERLNKWKLSTG